MNQAIINYALQGNKTKAELIEEAKEIVKKESPDISIMRGIRVNKNTIIYPKNKKRYEELFVRSNNKRP